MSPKPRGKQVVAIGILPPDVKVRSAWDIPQQLESVEVYARNLTMDQAQGFVRTFNKRALEERLPERKWAILCKHTRARRHGEHPDAIRARKAGAL